jgi:hypothetical protein
MIGMTRRRALEIMGAGAASALMARSASALRSASVSAEDPFIMPEDGPNPGNHDTNAKTRFTGSLAGATILLVNGQSNTANSFPTPYTATNTGAALMMNPYDGDIYNTVDPILGCSNVTVAGNFIGRLEDKLINSGTSTKVLSCSVSIDGTSSSQWNTISNYGKRTIVALRRLKAKGLTPHAILWGQGESDAGVAQATYQANVSALIALTRAEGYNGPWFIALQTMLSGVTDANIRAAQAALVNHPAGIWQGPDADTISTSFRQDGTHFTDAGADTYAGLWQTALHAFGAPF